MCLQNLYAPEDDPEMTVEYYDRNSSEKSDEFRIGDVNAENGFEGKKAPETSGGQQEPETRPLILLTQEAHLAEIGAASQSKHCYYTKNQSDENSRTQRDLLTPAKQGNNSLTPKSSSNSRRVSSNVHSSGSTDDGGSSS